MKRKNSHSSESGQALVLIVLGMVVFLGFTALAVDGGMIYSDRRHTQNAADSASLAGGGAAGKYIETNDIFWTNWNCSGNVQYAMTSAQAAAVALAASNDFAIDNDISDNSGVEVNCANDTSSGWPDRYIDIMTKLTKETATSFVHFVYGGPVANTVEAVTRIRPRTPLAFGHAIVAINSGGCSGNSNGVSFGGSSTTRINGGGVFSNGCLDGDGNAFNLEVTGEGAGINYAGEVSNMPYPGRVNMAPQQTAQLPQNSYLVPPPDCAGLESRSQGSNSVLEPGIYSSLKLTNGSLTLNPGLYCITGSPNAISINGGTVVANGVTLFITNSGAEVKITGGEHHMSAPGRSPDPSPAIPNVLMYSQAAGKAGVTLVGNGESDYLGTIYVPQGNIDISGSSDTRPTFNTQLIGFNVKVAGNADIDINFETPQNFTYDPKLELYK